jgi:uncharacterized protein (UPF0297 family)
MIYNNLSNKTINKKVNKLQSIMYNKLSNDKGMNEEDIEQIKKISSTKLGLRAFYLAYKDYINNNGYDFVIKEYINRIISYEKIRKNSIVRDKYKKSYILYLLSEFRIDSEKTRQISLQSLQDDSIYIRNNSLKLIQNIGDVELALQAINIINNTEKYFNEKILLDFLDNFKGDIDILDKKLLDILGNYNIKLKTKIIEHYSNRKNDSLEIRDSMLNYISTSDNKDVIISSTRYFKRVIDNRVANILNKNLKNEHWEVRAISAKVISKYPNKKAIDILKQTIGDNNYFVRYNSAFSLISMEEKDQIMEELLNHHDRFAKYILAYVMFVNNIIDFESYNNYKEKFAVQGG